jgi:hypothetical protein
MDPQTDTNDAEMWNQVLRIAAFFLGAVVLAGILLIFLSDLLVSLAV